MREDFEKEAEGGTEGGRSPSRVPPSGAPEGEGQARAGDGEGPEAGFVNPPLPPQEGPDILTSGGSGVEARKFR